MSSKSQHLLFENLRCFFNGQAIFGGTIKTSQKINLSIILEDSTHIALNMLMGRSSYLVDSFRTTNALTY
jgi:hypothetical protein